MISIVVPVLDEAERLGPLFDALEAQATPCEVIVADGGSRDGSAELAAKRARVVSAPPGRARQMNAGAGAARGEVLLFLHCDTRLPPGGLRAIGDAMALSGTAGGGFLHRFDREDRFARFISFSANTRSRLTKLFFGDQAIFVRREVFERMGGYAQMPLFEDWELSDRLRREGRVVIVETPVVTSARRIEVWGKKKCLTVWWGLSILYALGVPAERLARFYGHVR